MRPADTHLTPQELELVLLAGTGPTLTSAERAQAQEAQQHLEGCAYCQSVAKQYSRIDLTLGRLKAGLASKRSKHCPEENVWLELAAGSVDGSRLSELTEHAARCDYCGMHLREAAEDATTQPTEEVEAVVASLGTAQPDRQRALATSLARTPFAEERQPDQKAGAGQRQIEKARFPWWPRLIWAGGAIAVVAVAVLLGVRMLRQPDPNELLAKAFTEQRTIELRIPGAAYAPTRIERGRGRPQMDKPAALLDAESAISHRLQKTPNDPIWLDKKGRAELLDGDYNSAIETLKLANDLRPSAPEILTDLATGYFERAEAEDQTTDYGKAIELLSEVLQQNPDNQVALFNRAIAFERLLMYRESAKDWQRFLQLSSDKGWNAEARHHLSLIQEKLTRAENYSVPLMDYQTFSKRISAEAAPWSAVDSRIEDYLDQAVRVWLVAAFSESERSDRRAGAREALQLLAVILAKRHNDEWLEDLLASPESRDYRRAVLSLAQSVEADATGDPERAAKEARIAEGLFRLVANKAGRFRSQAELVYALHRSARGAECAKLAAPLEESVRNEKYPWLHTQILAEESICSGMVESLDRSRRQIASAISVAGQYSYPLLYLRALGLSAALDTDTGLPGRAWAKDITGLTLFWNGSYSPVRAYQFYSDLGFLPERSHEWNLALAIAREGATEASSSGSPAIEGLAYFRLANSAALAGDHEEAIREFEHADRIFGLLPASKTRQTYILDSKISLAELKTSRGDTDISLRELAQAEQQLSGISDYTIPLKLYETLGEIYSKRNRWLEARNAYTKAVKLSETALKSIHNEADRLRWDRETGRAYRGLLQSYLRLTNDFNGGLEYWDWYKAAGSRSAALRSAQVSNHGALLANLKAPAVPIHALNHVQRSLKSEIIVAYAQLPDEIISWTFSERGVKGLRVPVTNHELESTANRFFKECSDPKSSIEALRANGRKLYEWLIAPHLDEVKSGHQLIIEPDGVIGKVPFAALVNRNGAYLGDRFAIQLSRSVSDRPPTFADPPLSADQRALIVVSPALTLETGLKPLPEADQELNVVAHWFPRNVQLTGTAATPHAVERAMKNAKIFHYVGHSYGNFREFGLLLAGGTPMAPLTDRKPTLLTAEHISHLNLRGMRLVVLSSCSTESDPDQVLNDPDELVYAFLQAGVERVIASRWNVDSRGTTELMRVIYKRLAEGVPPEQSEKDASAHLRQIEALSHPYYWAGFYSFGS